MKQAIWSILFALLALSCFAQDPKSQASPTKQSGTPPAVMSPKATIPSPQAADGSKPPVETDPAKLAADSKTKESSLVDERTYVIGAEDVLQIMVWGDKNLSGNYNVRPDGRIAMQFVGEFRASGKTPEMLASDIADRLKTADILRNPQVTVNVVEVRSKMIYIIGEVNKPGKYALVVPTTALQALVNAGGFRDFANTKNIVIQRGTQRLKFNYKEVIQGKNIEQNILLQPEDHIIVK